MKCGNLLRGLAVILGLCMAPALRAQEPLPVIEVLEMKPGSTADLKVGQLFTVMLRYINPRDEQIRVWAYPTKADELDYGFIKSDVYGKGSAVVRRGFQLDQPGSVSEVELLIQSEVSEQTLVSIRVPVQLTWRAAEATPAPAVAVAAPLPTSPIPAAPGLPVQAGNQSLHQMHGREVAAFLAEDYKTAFALLLILTEARHELRLTAADLGFCYLYGLGTPVDYVKAGFWLEKAATLDNATAAFLLGEMHYTGSGVPASKEEARKWWSRGAALGDAASARNLQTLDNPSPAPPPAPAPAP